jgi:hypothetical protein
LFVEIIKEDVCGTSSKQREEVVKQSSACHLLQAGFLSGLLFNPEDGGNMFL